MPSNERTIFLNALEEESAEARAAYLQSACGDDAQLRESVDALLAASDMPENPLDTPLIATESKSTNAAAKPDQPTTRLFEQETDGDVGRVIGPYRLMEKIGEGGFGLVFVAQQSKPVRRKVALKIIKPGTGSKEVLARFDAERQAVAMMDDPNIAKVFDAGVTDDARPYFVMELVRGLPITDFCDHHQLSVRKRVELLEDVCAAIHHAHQKGVIHRDLKPSNVLVALHDARPVAKVIDFGVAKAIGHNLTDQTIYTRFYSMIGTPLYMSPEQTAMSGTDVDTRSDIYSLGVLLYQLLTGTTPFDRERLDSAGYDEMRRIIREEEPPKPSTRLTTIQVADRQTMMDNQLLPEASSAATSKRKRESIPSDLDWIVMKAMDKDRSRRYESAAAMAADLRRFMLHEQVEARPPSRSYQLSKFARRNRVALITVGLVAMALVLGTVASLYQASVAISERTEKEDALADAIDARNEATAAREEVENFNERLKLANSLVGNARTYEDSEDFALADAAYSDAVDLVPNYYLVLVQRARLRAKSNLWNEAATDFSSALDLDAPTNHSEWQGAAALFYVTERFDDYANVYAKLMTPTDGDAPSLTWSSVRACLVAPQSQNDAMRISERVDELAEESKRPGRDPRNRGGERDRPRSDGFGKQPPNREGKRPDGKRQEGKRGEGPYQFGPPHRNSGDGERGRGALGGREPNRRESGGRRGFNGPPPEGHMPRNIQLYIAAWASLRTGAPEAAINKIEQIREEHEGRPIDALHSLEAIAHHQAGRAEEAAAALAKSDATMHRLYDELEETPGLQMPWFDFVEAVLLHREATALVNGKTIPLDQRIIDSQEQARDAFGIAQ